MSDRQHECAEALDALERKRAAGEMSAGEADICPGRIGIVLAVVVVGIVLMRMGFGAVR